MKFAINVIAIICSFPLAEFLPIAIIRGNINPIHGFALIIAVLIASGASGYFAAKEWESKHGIIA